MPRHSSPRQRSEKRAKIIHAEGELIASEKLSQAAAVIGRESGAMTLRYLQTLTDIAANGVPPSSSLCPSNY
jgi:hypothetical protein